MSLGIYVHIPFCRQKCLYCDFHSYAGRDEWIDKYCRALKKEIQLFSSDQIVDTIYFGGGTPTVIGAKRLSSLLDTVRTQLSLSPHCEITCECNPGTVNEDDLKRLHEAGFQRLSLGLQSADDACLRRLGRIHTYDEFADCYHAARQAGFLNISVDLMYGLPDQTMDNWLRTIEKTLALRPEHLSCYALKIEEGTPFFDMELTLPDEDTIREMYDRCVGVLKENGYERYEISNFSKRGYESRHNIKYWQCDDYIGFGAGAHSCYLQKRFSNVLGISEYCDNIEKNQTACEDSSSLSLKDQMSEFCFLGLRMSRGICEKEFAQRFHTEISEVFKEALHKNLRRGTIERQDGFYRIAPDYLYVSNAILVDFI